MSALWSPRSLMESPLQWGLCLSEADFIKAQKQLHVPKAERGGWMASEFANATVHFIEDDGKHYALVCLRKEKRRPIDVVNGLLVHEAVHIWQRIRSQIGERKPSSEFEAYSIQRIAQDLMGTYQRMRTKK